LTSLSLARSRDDRSLPLDGDNDTPPTDGDATWEEATPIDAIVDPDGKVSASVALDATEFKPNSVKEWRISD
jgi:hypothetical protein